MIHNQLINRINAVDDLHDDLSQKSFVSLSAKEVDKIKV